MTAQMIKHSFKGAHAADIVKEILERTRGAYQSEDFEAFRDCFDLPILVETLNGAARIRTEDELHDRFSGMCSAYRALGVIDLYRKIVNAAFHDPHEIRATFLTRQILPGHVFGEDLVGHGIFRLTAAGWRVVRCHSATSSQPFSRIILGETGPDISASLS